MTTEERFDRIERVLDKASNTLGHIVDTQLQIDATQLQIDATLATLADSHIKTQEELRILTAAVKKTGEDIASLERSLQAYLTKRPQ